MKRVINYVGQVPLDTDLLSSNKNVLTAIGHVLQDMLGTSTLFSGLGCVPTSPAGMTVNVNPGRAYSLQAIDSGSYGSLGADAHQIVKQGILLDAVNFSCPAPTTAGFSINYLVQGAFQEVDTGSVVLPYYNASNPAQAYNGPSGTGAAQATARDNTVQLAIKTGVAATTGSQITPTPDAGFNGLWVITVAYGATSITSGNISQYSGAPFLTSPLLAQIQQAPSVVGQMRNLSMNVTAASATASLTADEIVVESALGGNTYKLSNFSKTINLAGGGAGGMDTGSAPSSGYVAIYAIYNPTTQTSALLATNATSAVQPNVYGGANMPSGYTASALVSVWPTSSSQFVVGSQRDRKIARSSVQVLSTTAQVSITALSVASAIPPNAAACSGILEITSGTGSTAPTVSVYANAQSCGQQSIDTYETTGTTLNSPFNDLMISVPQNIYYASSTTSGTSTYAIRITAYSI